MPVDKIIDPNVAAQAYGNTQKAAGQPGFQRGIEAGQFLARQAARGQAQVLA